MSLSQQAKHRLPTIKEGLLTGQTYTQIGEKLGVQKRTIDRDLKAFRQSGEFEAWLKEEWMRLHHIIIKQNPVEAYKQITRLIGHTITRRIEAKTEHKETVKIDVTALLQRYEETVETATKRNLQENHPRKQVDTSQS